MVTSVRWAPIWQARRGLPVPTTAPASGSLSHSACQSASRLPRLLMTIDLTRDSLDPGGARGRGGGPGDRLLLVPGGGGRRVDAEDLAQQPDAGAVAVLRRETLEGL